MLPKLFKNWRRNKYQLPLYCMDWYALCVYRGASLPEKGWISNKV